MAAKSKQVARKAKPPPVMVIRRDAAPVIRPAVHVARAEPEPTQPAQKPLNVRVNEMGGSHVVASLGAGAAGSMLGVLAVCQHWLSPKWAAGALIGTGVVTSTAGYFLDADHAMVTGAGLAAAGMFSLANEYAIDAYEAIEKRAEEKRSAAGGEQAKADAAKAGEPGKRKQATTRNGRRLVIIDGDGNPVEQPE